MFTFWFLSLPEAKLRSQRQFGSREGPSTAVPFLNEHNAILLFVLLFISYSPEACFRYTKIIWVARGPIEGMICFGEAPSAVEIVEIADVTCFLFCPSLSQTLIEHIYRKPLSKALYPKQLSTTFLYGVSLILYK